jgi:protein HIRA/HIR1
MIWKKSDYGGGAIFGGGGRENVESWRCVNTLRGHNGDVLDLAWSPGDTLLATASVDNTVIAFSRR